MPPQQKHQLGSSRLGQPQVLNTVRFTAGPNSTVPKSLVHARVVTPTNPYDSRQNVHQILRRGVPPFQKSAGIWNADSPPVATSLLGTPYRAHATRAAPYMSALHPCL